MQEKAYNQINSVLGDDEEPNGDSLQKMPYLGHHIKETQRLNKHCVAFVWILTTGMHILFFDRLYPVVAFMPRMLDIDIDILGYCVPAKVSDYKSNTLSLSLC